MEDVSVNRLQPCESSCCAKERGQILQLMIQVEVAGGADRRLLSRLGWRTTQLQRSCRSSSILGRRDAGATHLSLTELSRHFTLHNTD